MKLNLEMKFKKDSTSWILSWFDLIYHISKLHGCGKSVTCEFLRFLLFHLKSPFLILIEKTMLIHIYNIKRTKQPPYKSQFWLAIISNTRRYKGPKLECQKNRNRNPLKGVHRKILAPKKIKHFRPLLPKHQRHIKSTSSELNICLMD